MIDTDAQQQIIQEGLFKRNLHTFFTRYCNYIQGHEHNITLLAIRQV